MIKTTIIMLYYTLKYKFKLSINFRDAIGIENLAFAKSDWIIFQLWNGMNTWQLLYKIKNIILQLILKKSNYFFTQ